MSTPPPPPPSFDAGLPALDRLRERVEAAAAEIERLRGENADLAERVRELAAMDAAGGSDAPALRLDGDPDALRQQIEAFIEAIDHVLAEPTADGPPADNGTATA